MSSGDSLVIAVEPRQHLRGHAAAVVGDPEHQIIPLLDRLHLDVAVVPVRHAVDDGVLHQGLEGQLGHQTALKPVRRVDLAGEAVLKADELDVEIAVKELLKRRMSARSVARAATSGA